MTMRCAACRKELDGRRDLEMRPYCSVACRALGRAGLAWHLGPYRIVNANSSVVLDTGPTFDLTAAGIAEIQRKSERLNMSLPGKMAEAISRVPLEKVVSSQAAPERLLL